MNMYKKKVLIDPLNDGVKWCTKFIIPNNCHNNLSICANWPGSNYFRMFADYKEFAEYSLKHAPEYRNFFEIIGDA